MADDTDIRELIGRMSAAQRQGFHVTPGALRLVLAALRFYLAAQTQIARKPAVPHDDAPHKKTERYAGPPATIGDMRRQGLAACAITCDGPNCWNTRRVTFDHLALHDGTPFPDIPRSRRFRCSGADRGACESRPRRPLQPTRSLPEPDTVLLRTM